MFFPLSFTHHKDSLTTHMQCSDLNRDTTLLIEPHFSRFFSYFSGKSLDSLLSLYYGTNAGLFLNNFELQDMGLQHQYTLPSLHSAIFRPLRVCKRHVTLLKLVRLLFIRTLFHAPRRTRIQMCTLIYMSEKTGGRWSIAANVNNSSLPPPLNL